MNRRLPTLQNVAEQIIMPATECTLEQAITIAGLTHRYTVDRDRNGMDIANTAGYEQIVSDEDFWNIVAAIIG